MKKSLLGFIVLVSLISANVRAQTVTGKVTEAGDGATLAGVSILVKGTSTGTSTDADGKFSINLPDRSAVLVVSFIGFATQEIAVGDRTAVDVVLQEDRTQLSEVVVTALGIPRESKTLVYATQSVKPAELTDVRDANNILNSFSGKVAGALIMQGSGGPGSGSRMVLRGNRSIQGSNNALIVVDGVPINNNTFSAAQSDFGGSQSGDGASNLNPDDIESVTILRGASAAALYGSQAGNGVVVITTKKGKKDKIAVNINSTVTSDTPIGIDKLQNSYGQGQNGDFTNAQEGASWGAKLDGHTYTDFLGNPNATYSAQPNNVRDFYRTGYNASNSISVEGGTDKMQTYLSYTNKKTLGIIPNNNLLSHNVTMRISNQISKRFSTDAKVTYLSQTVVGKQQPGEGTNSPNLMLFIPRNISVAQAKQFEVTDASGVPLIPSKYDSRWPSPYASLYQNPYWMLNRILNTEARSRMMGFLLAKFKFTDWLSIQGRANLDTYNDKYTSLTYDGSLGSKPGGTYDETNVKNTQQWYDLMLEGQNKLGGDFKVNYRLGAIYFDTKNEQLSSSSGGLNVTDKFSLNFSTNPSFYANIVEVQTQSVFAQANFAWKESIFLDASYRNDWDSRLPKPYSFPYYSVGLSAIISDLVALPKAVSFLKLNANYAEVGNGGQPQIRFNTYSYGQGAGNGFIQRSLTQALPNLKPEIVKNIELGIDAKFLENRLGFTFTVYNTHSFNQLLTVNLPPATGYSQKYINAGDIQNKGYELTINAMPLKGDLTWNVAFNMGGYVNKVIKLDPDVTKFFLSTGFRRSAWTVVSEGRPYGDLEAFKWQRTDNGKLVVDATTGKPIITKEQERIGNFNPRAILGITNTFDYKKFSLRFLVDGRIGGIVVSGTEGNLAYFGTPAATAINRDTPWSLGGVQSTPVTVTDPITKVVTTSWPEGGAVNVPVTAQGFWQTATGGRYSNGEFFAYDATNIRLREISFGYNIPIPSNFVIKAARISFVARNVFFIYRGSSVLDIPGIGKRKMTFDPEMGIGNSNYQQGVVYGTFPNTRSLGGNLRLTF